MELHPGKIAVVTGGASGIGFALANRFCALGMSVMVSDIDTEALEAAASQLAIHGSPVAIHRADVSVEEEVEALAATTVEHFGGAHLICNNAGVGTQADPWFGPMAAWQWVMGVNLFGVVHGIRAFLPILISQGEGHVVNTASIAGLMPGAGASYDASKHAVVALTEDLYRTMVQMELPIGVSVLCPGWVRTRIIDAERNWPADLGAVPPPGLGADVDLTHRRRPVDAGHSPEELAELVVNAVRKDQFWVLPHAEFVDMAIHRWQDIAKGVNPHDPLEMSGLPRATTEG